MIPRRVVYVSPPQPYPPTYPPASYLAPTYPASSPYPPAQPYPSPGYPAPSAGYMPPQSTHPQPSYPPTNPSNAPYPQSVGYTGAPSGSYPQAAEHPAASPGYQNPGYSSQQTSGYQNQAHPTEQHKTEAYSQPATSTYSYQSQAYPGGYPPQASNQSGYRYSQQATSSYPSAHYPPSSMSYSYGYSTSYQTPYVPAYAPRSYVRGWTPTYDPYADFCPTITDAGAGSATRGVVTPAPAPTPAAPVQLPYAPGGHAPAPPPEVKTDVKLAASKRYEELVRECLAKGHLWEDTDFPARDSSLFYSKSAGMRGIEWKRPNEICSSPKFSKGASRMDVVQGKLGDCWLLAAIADLTTNPVMFNKVVPQEQTFEKGKYAGIFRFYFWQYGRWVEVLVDDRLPTQNGKLIYMTSEQRGEFWSSLLEKAYAKLCGSYESLSGGAMCESFEDFTGGIAYRQDLRSKAPPHLFELMLKAHDKGALMGCSIDSGAGNREGQLANGLIVGHAYSITDVTYLEVAHKKEATKLAMVRVRNPWGDDHEWNRAWSDKSSEWGLVSESEKQRIGVANRSPTDGEFWMSFEDFVREFEHLEFCLLGPDSGCGTGSFYKKVWEGTLLEGSWKRRVNAGGCRNFPDTFWTNPQYKIHVTADSDCTKGEGTIIIGLMQRNGRARRKEGKDNHSIGYYIFQLTDPSCGTLGREYFDRHKVVAKSPNYIDQREVAEMHKLPAGDYVIVPSTFEQNLEADFILRVFHEKAEHRLREMDDDHTTMNPVKAPASIDSGSAMEAEDTRRQNEFFEEFKRSTGGVARGQVDAYQLKDILTKLYAKEVHVKEFSTDLCRSLVALHDHDMTGKLSFEEYKELQKDFSVILKVFKANDKSGRGYFNSYELRTILHTVADESAALKGLRISNATFNAVAMRYSDQEGRVYFDDFLACVSKLKILFETFKAKDDRASGLVAFHIDEFIQLSIYS